MYFLCNTQCLMEHFPRGISMSDIVKKGKTIIATTRFSIEVGQYYGLAK